MIELFATNSVHQTRGVKKRIHLVGQLFDIERDFYCLLNVTGLPARFRCLAETGCLIQAFPHQHQLCQQHGSSAVWFMSAPFLPH